MDKLSPKALMQAGLDAQSEAGNKKPVKVIKKGGKVKKYSKGGTASSRADGIATKGKTKGKIC